MHELIVMHWGILNSHSFSVNRYERGFLADRGLTWCQSMIWVSKTDH